MEQENQTPIEEDPYYLITLYQIKQKAPDLPEHDVQELLHLMMDYVNKKKRMDEIIPYFILKVGSDEIVRTISESIRDGEDESKRNTEKFKQQSLRTGRKVIQNWTDEEDRRLLYAIHKYGQNDWNVIADFCANGRNRSQCAQRWNRVLDPRISKDPWTEAEEARLKELVDEHGEKSWKVIADILGNRTDIQCRYHYKNVMQKKVKDKKKPTSTRIDYGSDDGLPMTRKSYALQQKLQKQQEEEREQNQQAQQVQQPQQQQSQILSIQSMQVQPIRQVPIASSMSSLPQTTTYTGQQFYSPYAAQPAAQMMVMQPQAVPSAIPQAVPQSIQTTQIVPTTTTTTTQPIQQQQNDPNSAVSQANGNNNNSSYSVPFILKDLLSNPLAADPKPMEPEMSWLSTVETKAPPKVIDEY